MAEWEDAPSASATVSPAGSKWEDAPTKKEEPSSKYSVKDILKRATALPEAAIKGIGRVTGQEVSMEPTKPTQLSPKERLMEAGGATGFGAAAGLALPKLLSAIPATKPIGMAMELVPPTQRMLGGALGGAASDITRQAAESAGAPTAVKVPLEILSASIGDIAGQKLTQSATNLVKSAYYAGKGNIPLAASYAGGIFGQSPEIKAQQATARQAQIFGKPTGRVEGEVTNKFEQETQQALKEQYGFGKKVPIYEPTTGKEVMAPGTDMRVPAKGVKPSSLEPTGETAIPRDLKPGQKVSEALRDEFYTGVNQATNKLPVNERFSASPEYKQFLKSLQPLVEIGPDGGGISSQDFNRLKQALGSDMGSLASRQRYAQTVDNIIRNWQPKVEEGKKAISATVDKDVREQLRNSFAVWSEKNGLGNPEKSYRSAFKLEKDAEAKDKIPFIVSQYGSLPKAQNMAKQIAKDPSLKPELAAAIKEKLSNTPVEKLDAEFKRIDNLLVDSELATPKEMAPFRKLVKEVESIRKKGGNATPILERVRNELIRAGILTAGAQTSATGVQLMEGK